MAKNKNNKPKKSAGNNQWANPSTPQANKQDNRPAKNGPGGEC